MEELNSSELGTQEYWEKCYQHEIKHFVSRGDPGEIWFGEDIVDRVIQWMNKSELIRKESKIVDVGCGNGMLLIELANEGYSNLSGLDYSENAITLAKTIAEKHKLDIKYAVANILEALTENYDIVLDKGTYDAVSLSNDAKEKRQLYIENIWNCLNSGGIFIITSCNWTLNELNEHFGIKFNFLAVIPTPQFKFGGKVGSVVTSCVFQKK